MVMFLLTYICLYKFKSPAQDNKVCINIMENTPKITIEELAVKLNGTMWTKGDLKRIYLDKGFNTKKMSTKTYVEETSEGNFNVKCFVECPSQDYNWCKSQANQVIESVDKEIAEALVTEYFLVMNDDTALFIDDCGNEKAMNDIYGSDLHHSKRAAERFIEKQLSGNYSVQLISREAFDRQVAELDAIEKTWVAPVVQEKVIYKPLTETEQNLTFVPGTKVIHSRFGKGEIIGMDNEDPAFRKLTILFEDGTQKSLLERFANLEKVDFIKELKESLVGKTEFEKKNLCFAALKKLEVGETKDQVHEMCDYYLSQLDRISGND